MMKHVLKMQFIPTHIHRRALHVKRPSHSKIKSQTHFNLQLLSEDTQLLYASLDVFTVRSTPFQSVMKKKNH